MKYEPVRTAKESRALRRMPVIAVDLGFSTRRASCGLAYRVFAEESAGGCHFGMARMRIVQLAQRLKELVLILEAPLSSCFGSTGRPHSRGRFENATAEGGADTRYWCQAPGVGMAFAALLLLRDLAADLQNAEATVYLLEAFFSRDTASLNHAGVARAIRAEFLEPTREPMIVVPPLKGTVLSVLDLLDPTLRRSEPPVIILPPLP